MVAHRDFLTAIKQGDVPTVDEYFAQPLVYAMVQELNDCFLTDPPKNVLMPISWFSLWRTREHNDITDGADHVFQLAIENGQLDVLAWFFAVERLPFMGATLALMINHIACSAVEMEYPLPRPSTASAEDNAGAMEILLSSRVFCDLLTTANRQTLLQESIGYAVHRYSCNAISLLLSHGAQLDLGKFVPLELCAMRGGPRQVDVLVENGAVVIGSPLLKISVAHRNLSTSRRLVELGVDDKDALFEASYVGVPEFAQIVVDGSFSDVDERMFDQKTPLLLLLKQFRLTVCGEKRAQRMARVLIEFGADVTAMNVRGKTALHLLAGSVWDGEIVELLLRSGADPNAKTKAGKTVLDFFDTSLLDNPLPMGAEQRLETLVKYGADPFNVGRSGRSMYDRLLDTVAGQEFVVSHPEHFTTLPSRDLNLANAEKQARAVDQ